MQEEIASTTLSHCDNSIYINGHLSPDRVVRMDLATRSGRLCRVGDKATMEKTD